MAACWCALPGRTWRPPTTKLVPVKLRRGGRILGGSLSWDKPQQLAAFSREGPFNGMPVPKRRHRNPAGAGGTRLAAHRSHLGDARRRHAAGHRAAPRQGCDRAVPRHRRHALVGPAAVRRVRRHAAAHRVARGLGRERRRRKRRRPEAPPSRTATGGAADPRARWFRRLLGAAADRAADPGQFTGRATADHPPGFYGPPEGLVAVNTLAPADRPVPLDVSSLNARLDVYRQGEPLDLRGPMFLAALALLLLDALVVFWLSGGLGSCGMRRRAAARCCRRTALLHSRWHRPCAGADRLCRTRARSFAAASKTSP